MFGDKTGNALPNGYNDPSIKLLHPTVPLRFEVMFCLRVEMK